MRLSENLLKRKAKVVRIDKLKGEAIVTLLAAVVPIPVTVKLDNVKVIRREKEEGEEENGETGTVEGMPEKPDKEKKEEVKEEAPALLGSEEEQPLLSEDYEEQTGGLIPDDY